VGPVADDDPVGVIVALGRALQAAGVPAGQDRVGEAVRAVAALRPSSRADVYWAGRATLCASPQHTARYDAVFAALFDGGGLPRPRAAPVSVLRVVPITLVDPAGTPAPPAGEDDGEQEPSLLRSMASTVDVLRHKDVTTLDPDEKAALHRALAALELPGEPRPSRRWRPAPHRGAVDPRRTVRALLRAGGEPVRLHHRRHTDRARPVVLLVDVSGSMSGYADVLLRFAHVAARRRRAAPTEVFTIGTRLTRVTRELSSPDPDTALAAVAAAVPDYSGGTRLGVLVQDFLDRWGHRGMARGAVVVVLSDGWERDDPALLGAQMRRLALLAHRVVWCNPRKGQPGFAPLAGGLAAALPHVDDFVEGHSLAALERLARVVAGVSRPAAVRPVGGRPVAGQPVEGNPVRGGPVGGREPGQEVRRGA
jgi:uncharacterized protein with von Willebrand factor type A (vWA) domain